jgi:hypothetical protein
LVGFHHTARRRERSELLVGRHTHQGPRLCRFHPGRSGRVSERAIKQHIAAFASLANHTGTAAAAAARRKSQKSLLRPRRRLLFMVAAFAAKSRPLQRFAAAPNAPAVNKWNAQNRPAQISCKNMCRMIIQFTDNTVKYKSNANKITGAANILKFYLICGSSNNNGSKI